MLGDTQATLWNGTCGKEQRPPAKQPALTPSHVSDPIWKHPPAPARPSDDRHPSWQLDYTVLIKFTEVTLVNTLHKLQCTIL